MPGRETLARIEKAVLDALAFDLVSSESMQAQTLADAFRTLAILLATVPDPWSERLADIARRALSSLGEHVLTFRLEAALDALRVALDERGHRAVGDAVRAATAELATTLGALNARSTRVPPKAA